MYPKYFLHRKLTMPFVLFYQFFFICKSWLFEKFIFELEASYSFKITCILVRQVISLQKNDGFISKIYCLVSWSLISTPLILVSALKKMASTSTTVIYNSMRVDTLANFLYKGKRSKQQTIYFSFRLEIGVRNFNHVDEFVFVTKLKKGRINIRRTNL